MSNNGFAQFRVQQAGHGVFDLIEQLINNAVKLDLHAFAFCSRDRHALDFHVKADDDCVRMHWPAECRIPKSVRPLSE